MEAPDLHQPRTAVDLHPRIFSRTTSVAILAEDRPDTDPVGDLPEDGAAADVVDFVADLHPDLCEVDLEASLDPL